MYQVKWFSKMKGYGFVENSEQKQFFVHHTDIQVGDGFRYLKEGEYIRGVEEMMETTPSSDDTDTPRVKIAQIRAPMDGGKLMCEIERTKRSQNRHPSSGPRRDRRSRGNDDEHEQTES